MQTQTSNTLHNAIMEAGGKDRPPMLAPGIDNDIYSIVDACPNACEMWKANERSQQAATMNRGKAIVNSPLPIYDQEPSIVVEDDEMSKDKEIDKLMALISLSFKKINKPTNNNLRTSSNTSRANQDNSPRINRGVGYDNQRLGHVTGAKETVGTTVVQKYRIQCYNCKEFGHVERECQKPKSAKDASYHREKMLLYAADSGPIFDSEPMQKVSNDDHYNVFAIECEHPEQSKYVHDTYPIEQDEHNVIIDSLDMSYDREQIGQNDDDDDDLANEQSLKSQLETQKTHFLNEIGRLSREYYYADYMNAIRGVIVTTSVSRLQLKSNLMEDRVMLNNSQGKKYEVEDQHRNVKFSKNKTSTACNDSLYAKTSNVNFVCATCGKCVLNEKHDMCVLKSRNSVNSRTKMPIVVPVTTREPKRTVEQSVAKPLRKTLVEIVIFIVDSGCSKHMTGNLKLLINFVEKFLGTVTFRNDQIAPILGYGDLVQGSVTIKRVYYVEGLNHSLFSVGQFCDADLEVAFQKSACYIRDLKGNDLLTATSSQACLWHHCLSHLNFDTINFLSKNDIVVGLPKLKFVKDHLCSSCELGKLNECLFKQRLPQAPKDGYNFYTWTYVVPCGGLHAKVRIVRTDKGTEFLNKTLHAYFASEGILHQTFVARTPEQNGVVERRNRTLVEAARTMLSVAKVLDA
nr:hypothetical protein [Tanacetum cinerariifolium]